ncbi:MAG: hypothetical protein U5K73_08595 [Halofilum sp. (in: g-proteobacteria)]|nr:hypothetical protein [Halofilum sp. (in: g-proteobacteria)]
MIDENQSQSKSTMRNIDYFNACCAVVFDLLYQAFPEKIELAASDIAKPAQDLLRDGEEPRFDDSWDAHKAAFAALEWLWESDYIRIRGNPNYRFNSFTDCVLTPKALEALNATPCGIAPDTEAADATVGAMLRRAVSEGMFQAARNTVTRTISMALGMG